MSSGIDVKDKRKFGRKIELKIWRGGKENRKKREGILKCWGATLLKKKRITGKKRKKKPQHNCKNRMSRGSVEPEEK